MGPCKKCGAADHDGRRHRFDGKRGIAPPSVPVGERRVDPTRKYGRGAPFHARRPTPLPGARAKAPTSKSASRVGLQGYFREVRAFPLLTRAQEHDLATSFASTRAPELARQLVQANLRFVIAMALAAKGPPEALLDLIQEGNLGLMHAVEKFDPARGFKLITYAGAWIRAYINLYLMKNKRLVRMGTTQPQRILYSALARTRARLEVETGGEVSSAQIAKALKVKAREVDEMSLRLGAGEVPLDRRSDDGETQDWLPAEGAPADELLARRQGAALVRQELGAMRDALNPRMRAILERRMLAEEPATLNDLAVEFGVTRERVRQLEEQIKKALRERLQNREAA